MLVQNWPGPIKVPFPVQCAAKLAKLFEDLNQAGHRKLKTHPSLETCVSLPLLLRSSRTMRVDIIGHFEPCMTEIYLHIDARVADYIRTHP